MAAKTFWLIHQYASTPETGIGGRHYYLAKELAKQDHKVYVIAAGFTHLLREPPELKFDYTVQQITPNFDFVWVRLPRYRDAHHKKRVLNDFLFAWKLKHLPKKDLNVPDVILTSSPSLISFLSAQSLAKKFKAKLAFEVRDIWPLTLVELGGYSPFHPFIILMQWIEDKAYNRSNVVISNLPNSVEHMVSRGMDSNKFAWIPNGFDMAELENAHPLNELEKGLPKDKFVIGYTGTFGVANALGSLLEAAKLLQHKTDIVFVLVGDGKEKQDLFIKARDLKNVIFIDPIPKKQIQSMLKFFDVCFIGCQSTPLYRFGIAPNKIPEYMFAAKPILKSCNDCFDFVKKARCGVSVEAENPQAIADGILRLKSMTREDREILGNNGRTFALASFNYAKVAKKFSRVLLQD